jgi:hypothetical protein
VRKFVVIALVVVLALCVVALFVADSVMRAAVEQGGTYALGVDTKLDGASLAPIAGQVELKGLQVANPSGFNGPYFLRLADAKLQVTTASLLGDVVEAPSFELEGLDMYIERANGHTNYGAILDALKKLESQGGKPAKSGGKGQASEGAGKKFIVRDVRLRNLRVHTDLAPELGAVSKAALTIPEVHLTNIGTADGGASVSELVSALVQAVLSAAVQAGGDLPKALLNDISSSLSKLDAKSFKDLEKQINSGEAGQAIGDLGKDLKKVFK